MSRTLRALGATALSLALLSPVAAHADRWGGSDPAGDVTGWQYQPDPEPCGTFLDVDGAAEAHEDITYLGVRHTRHDVVATVRFSDLDAASELATTIYLRTARGGFWLDLDRFQSRNGQWRTLTFLAHAPRYPDPEDIDECGGFGFASFDLGCRIAHTVDAAADLVRLTVPRRCIKNPRWVRAGADAYRFIDPEDGTDPTFGAFSDDWSGGTVLTKWRISYGPRVAATAGATLVTPPTGPRTGVHRYGFAVRQDGIFRRR